MWLAAMIGTVIAGDAKASTTLTIAIPLAVFLVETANLTLPTFLIVAKRISLSIVYLSFLIGVAGVSWAFSGPVRHFHVLGNERLVGIMASPNGLAGLAVLGLILVAYTPGRLWPLHLSIVVLTILATDGRASLVLGAIALVIALIARSNRWVIAPTIWILTAAGLLWAFANGVFALLISGGGTFATADTLAQREYAWHFVEHEAHRQPLFGFGVDAWPNWQHEGLSPLNFPSAHNTFFQVLSVSGWLGVAFLLILTLQLIHMAARVAPDCSQNRTMHLCLLGFLLVRSVTEIAFTTTDFTVDNLPGLVVVMALAVAGRSRLDS
jgi:O-antigen ligase